ncbi:hypothetical protein QFA96_16070 [Pseudomonas sp. Ap32]|nr:hypothetical protein QFA96_16070 [Pseudomonas sp. Ap32]
MIQDQSSDERSSAETRPELLVGVALADKVSALREDGKRTAPETTSRRLNGKMQLTSKQLSSHDSPS